MTTVTYQGIHFTEKMLAEEKTSDLLKTYNRVAADKGAPIVKKFSDHKTAVRRTWAILQKYGGSVKKQAKPTGEKRTRTKRFDYVAIGPAKPRRESTPDKPVLRDMLLMGMLRPEGLSYNQAVEIVGEFDALRLKLGIKTKEEIEEVSVNARTRAYEAMRLVHYYLNYSTKQDGDGDDAPIRIVANRRG